MNAAQVEAVAAEWEIRLSSMGPEFYIVADRPPSTVPLEVVRRSLKIS